MEQSHRKPLRLPEYSYDTPGAYFVTICTKERNPILGTVVGAGDHTGPTPNVGADDHIRPYIKLSKVGILVDQYTRTIPGIDRYVIMPDHIHLLLRFDQKDGTGDPFPTVGNVIGWYKYQVTKQANAQFNSFGERLFQRSYYDHVIRNQQDYNEVWEYIENNPRKWVIQNRGDE